MKSETSQARLGATKRSKSKVEDKPSQHSQTASLLEIVPIQVCRCLGTVAASAVSTRSLKRL
jgi:hypothetical protein